MTLPTPAPEGAVGSQPVSGTGVSANNQPTVGAFPTPSVAEPPNGQRKSFVEDTSAPKANTSGLVIGTDGSTAKAKAPVEIPKVPWTEPKTVVAANTKLPGEKAVITYVEDGDTASYKDKSGNVVKCRIDTIDAPETSHSKYGKAGQAYGEESKKILQEMILNKEVTVRIAQPAQEGKNYGRNTCQIEIEGKNIDRAMLEAGAAWVYKSFRTNPDLVKAESGAKQAKRGLWADPAAANPEVFRKLQNSKRLLTN